VGTAEAERGHKATGFIEVPAGVDAGTSMTKGGTIASIGVVGRD
jgi:hypothetical protein